MKGRYKKENLDKAVKISNSVSGVCRELDISTRGGNYNTVKKYINLYNINISHFMTKEEQVKKMVQANTTPIEEIFCVNSKVNQSSLRKAVKREGNVKYKCSSCKTKGEWGGEKLTLQLDHINGIPNDNRLENLRYLCPNCHSQTKTWGFRGRGLNNKCPKCNKKISKNSKRCQSCANSILKPNLRKVDRPPYKQLLGEVEELGYCAVGRNYGVSDNTIRKWIKVYKKYGK